MRLILSIAIVGLLLSGCGVKENGEELVVALRPDKDPDAMMEERDALTGYLSERLGRGVRVIIPTSGAVIEQGLGNGTVDLAWVSSTSLAQYRGRGIGDLLLVSEVDGKTSYESYWLGRAGSGLSGVESLRMRPVAFASPTSTSGYVIPLHDLYQRGHVNAQSGAEGYFGDGNVHFGTGYVSAVLRVLDGSVDAAAVSDYVYLGDKHLSAEQKSQLEVVARQGPVPTHCLAVRRGLDPELLKDLQSALLALGEENPELEQRIFGGPLTAVDADAHLQPIESALEFVRQLH